MNLSFLHADSKDSDQTELRTANANQTALMLGLIQVFS